MKKNLGKTFENNWKASIPINIFSYRFRDSGSSFYGGNDNLRFSTTNIADDFIFYNGKLFLNELKHHHGKSIPLSCIIPSKTKQNQINDLVDADKFDDIFSNLIVFFSDVERCFCLRINDFVEYVKTSDKKSIPISYFEEKGIEISVSRLKVNYRYDVLRFLNKF